MATESNTTPVNVQKIAARLLRVGDRIPVTTGTDPVRLAGIDGLDRAEWTVATVTAIEYRPLDFWFVATDVHDGRLVFLADELVEILPRQSV